MWGGDGGSSHRAWFAVRVTPAVKGLEGSCKTAGITRGSEEPSGQRHEAGGPGGRLHSCRLWAKTRLSGNVRNALSQAPGAGPAICTLTRAPGTLLTPLQHHGADGQRPQPPGGCKGRLLDPGSGVGIGWAPCPVPSCGFCDVDSMLSRVRMVGTEHSMGESLIVDDDRAGTFYVITVRTN